MARYRNNINLPDFYDSQQEEKKIIKFWCKQKIFEKIQNARRESTDQKLWCHSGPVFPTGSPHPGHILNGIVKDVFTRYAHQKNRLVESRFGWDCHGLPVEHLVDKELGIKSLRDVQVIGVPAYNEECRSFVQRHAAKWKNVYERVGNWVDFTKEYQTMSTDYMEGVWRVFKQLYDRGLVYQDTKVLPYSTACHTHLSNFEAEQNYKEVTEAGMNICVDIVGSDEKLLLWTTSPCALIANSAVCVNPKAVYVKVNKSGVVYILSKSRLQFVFKNPSEYTVLEEFLGEALQGLKYEPLFDPIPESRDLQVLLDSSVPDDIGTGVTPLDEAIVESLKERGVVHSMEEVTYKKPYCWRSDTPLISKKVSSWFIRVEELAAKLLENNSQINWCNDNEKKNFEEWLKDHSQDWAVSRSRYWGTPIPIWSSESGDEVVCVGSIEELKQLTGKKDVIDLHRECVDWMKIPSRTPGNPPLRRVPEVFDCWFESGALPFITEGTPAQAEFVAEGIDQTRGWFYTTLVLSTALTQPTPFRNVFATGLVQEPDGSKVSKRKHNHNEPMRLIEKYGADCLRLYLLSSPLVKCECFVIQEEGVANIAKTLIQPLYRIFNKCTRQLGSPSWVNYGYVTEWYNFSHPLDKWIMSCTESVLKFYDAEMKAYRMHAIMPRLIQLIHQIEDWYVPIRYPDLEPTDYHPTSCILFNVIYRLCLMLAPFAPFFTEYIYQIHRPFFIQWRRKESIHDAQLIPLNDQLIHMDLELRVSRMQTVVEIVRDLRIRHKVPPQYQISKVVVIHHDPDYLQGFEELKETMSQLLNTNDVSISNDYRQFHGIMKVMISSNSPLKSNQQITTVINDLRNEEVVSLIQEDPISILEQIIPLDDIQVYYDVHKELESNYAIESKDDLIVVMKMNKSLFYYEEGAVKEIANHIQKLKKKGSYFPNDPAVVYYSTKDKCLLKLMAENKGQLNKTTSSDLIVNESSSPVKEDDGFIVVPVDIKGLSMKMHLSINNCRAQKPTSIIHSAEK